MVTLHPFYPKKTFARFVAPLWVTKISLKARLKAGEPDENNIRTWWEHIGNEKKSKKSKTPTLAKRKKERKKEKLSLLCMLQLLIGWLRIFSIPNCVDHLFWPELGQW